MKNEPLNEICLEAVGGIIEVLRDTSSRRGLSAPATALMTLGTLEFLNNIASTCCKILALHPNPNDTTEHEDRFAALLVHNLTIRESSKLRVIVEQTCNEFEARYGTPSQLGLDIIRHLNQVFARKPQQ